MARNSKPKASIEVCDAVETADAPQAAIDGVNETALPGQWKSNRWKPSAGEFYGLDYLGRPKKRIVVKK